tara:strand:+ start:380 stop:580 length:201 start_codon:yes stop_codon:yes gene_type:complete
MGLMSNEEIIAPINKTNKEINFDLFPLSFQLKHSETTYEAAKGAVIAELIPAPKRPIEIKDSDNPP